MRFFHLVLLAFAVQKANVGDEESEKVRCLKVACAQITGLTGGSSGAGTECDSTWAYQPSLPTFSAWWSSTFFLLSDQILILNSA